MLAIAALEYRHKLEEEVCWQLVTTCWQHAERWSQQISQYMQSWNVIGEVLLEVEYSMTGRSEVLQDGSVGWPEAATAFTRNRSDNKISINIWIICFQSKQTYPVLRTLPIITSW
jgi:hypothetical protein